MDQGRTEESLVTNPPHLHASGRVTGPHLHWIVRYGNVSVDGQSLLALSSPPVP